MPQAAYFLSRRVYHGLVPPGSDSAVFVCAHCGEAWARVSVPGSSQWLVESVPCEGHRPAGVADSFRISGSILPIQSEWAGPQYGATMLENLPPELVRREFLIHLAHVERKVYHYGNEETSLALA